MTNNLRRFTDHNLPSFGGGLYRPMSLSDPAAIEGRTRYPATRTDPRTVKRLLKSGHNNRKIGKFVTKGRLKGCPIYTLTLEERATCPSTCAHWLDCYGNQMHWAQRMTHGLPLERRLDLEIRELALTYPRGFLVRLHVLGDFYSPQYVKLWERWLMEFPNLNVFGFSHWHSDTAIGDQIDRVRRRFWPRFAIRFSNRGGERNSQTVRDDRVIYGAVRCPEQQDKTDCCGTCALCWSTDKPIIFGLH